MKRFEINDRLHRLKVFVFSVPDNFKEIGTVLQDNRNIIKKMELPTGPIIVKCFKGMYFFNKLAYSIFRKSKAERSYKYAEILLSRGILTPLNVAWIDCYHWGFLKDSYYMSLFNPDKTLAEVIKFYNENAPSHKISLYHHLAAFTLTLHNAGIYHGDYSLTNILVNQDAATPKFSLVDLNRIQFKKTKYRMRLKNMEKFSLPSEDIQIIISE